MIFYYHDDMRETPVHQTKADDGSGGAGNAGAGGGAPAVSVESFSLGPFATNCSIVSVEGHGGCWIIDASFEPRRLIERIVARGLKPEVLILTHAHIDHIAGIDDVRRAFPGIPVWQHRDEASWLGDAVLNLSEPFGEPYTTRAADRLLDGGEALTLGGTSWRVLHTPGHSPGGITLWCEAASLAIVGDTLFNGSIGRYDFPTSDGRQLARSIREVLYAMPDETRVYCGHGPSTQIGWEKRSNPFVKG